MNDLTTLFGEHTYKVSVWWLIARIAIPAAFAVVGLCQTSCFGRFLPGYDYATIQEHMKSCKDLQNVREKGREKRIDFDSFGPDLEQRLRIAVDSFRNDELLNTRLKSRFGKDFTDLDVVVIPSWEITSKEKADLYGITLVGWSHADKARNTDYVGAYTLRERPNEGKVTTDGRSRIIINPSAFQSENALRFTLFHELLHTLNIPGYDPPWYFFAQDDLRYLREYREEVDRRGWILYSQAFIWILAVVVPFGIALAQIRYACLYRAGQRRVQSEDLDSSLNPS